MGLFILRVAFLPHTFAFLLLISVSCAFGLQPAGQDTVVVADSVRRSYSLNEVIVISSRLPQVASLSSSPVTVVDAEHLRHMNATSLGDVLSSVGGIFVKDYGGVSGLKTIAQRGLGPEHTLILVNGMRASTPQLNLVDLSLFSVEDIDRLEVLHGGNSASFGSDALAGVVNIVTSPSARGSILRAQWGVGSFGYQHTHIAGSVGDSLHIFQGSYREETSNENFPFQFRNGNERYDLTRRNADFSARTGTLQSSLSVSSSMHADIFARLYDAERGVPGLVAGPFSSSIARQRDKDEILQLQVGGSVQEALHYQVGLQLHSSYVRYRDNALTVGATSLDNYYRNREWRIEPGVDYTIGDCTRVALGGEFSDATAEGNAILRQTSRRTTGAYAAIEQQLVGETGVVTGLVVYPSLRFDGITTEARTISQWSPQFGLVLSFGELVGNIKPLLRASVSRNFSAPTFNQLYYAGGGGKGNPDLLPERSTSVDIGGAVTADLFGSHQLSCSFFNIDMHDRIQWVSSGVLTVIPKNIRDTRSRGVEVMYAFRSRDEVVSFEANASSTSARKLSKDYPGDPNVNTRLIYIPANVASFSLTVSPLIWDSPVKYIAATVNHSFVGKRYTTEDNTNILPAYSVTNVNIGAKITMGAFNVNMRLEVNNVFNTEYQTIISYPMPGRSYRATFGVEYQ